MKQLKIVGFSLLALAAVMAMSASAAQAEKYEVTVGGKVLSGGQTLELKVSVAAGELLVPKLGLAIRCDGGEGILKLTLSATQELLGGPFNITFKKCRILEFEETCSVHSKGDAAGIIKAGGSGDMTMPQAKLYVYAPTSGAGVFSDIIIDGDECPLVNVSGVVTGSIEIEIEAAETFAKIHNIKVIAQKLLYGLHSATLEALGGAALTGTVEEVTGLATSIKLKP